MNIKPCSMCYSHISPWLCDMNTTASKVCVCRGKEHHPKIRHFEAPRGQLFLSFCWGGTLQKWSECHLFSKREQQHHGAVGRAPTAEPGPDKLLDFYSHRLHKTKMITTSERYWKLNGTAACMSTVWVASKSPKDLFHSSPEPASLPGESAI